VTGGGVAEFCAAAKADEPRMQEKPREKIDNRNERGTELLHGGKLVGFMKTDLLQAFMVNLPV
jgi:hypothetical protein